MTFRLGKHLMILGLFFFGFFFFFGGREARAAIYEVTIENDISEEIHVNIEDYIVFKAEDKAYQYTFFCNENGKQLFYFGNGKYFVSAAGRASVIISGRDANGKESFIADYRIIISDNKSAAIVVPDPVKQIEEKPIQSTDPSGEKAETSEKKAETSEKQLIDMEKVTINTTELLDKRTVIKSKDKRISSFVVDISSPEALVENQNASLSFKNDNPSLSYTVSLKNKLYLNVKGSGEDVLTVTINEKDFLFRVNIEEKGLNETTVVLAVGDSYQLKLKGFEDSPLIWSSDREEVAKISKKGKVTALSEGSSVITVNVDGETFAAVISVTSQLKKEVVNYTRNYSSGSKYSQPKRMQEGFYDCSSLVWRAYKKFGHIILIDYYAPVAAAMGKYYEKNKKVIEGGVTRENIEKRAFMPGDLLFVEGKRNNRRYRNIDHVEMIYGYSIEGIDAEGKPILGILYANNQQYNFTGFVGRPNTDESELGVNSF